MKTYKFFAIAMATVATASCAKEIAQTNAPEENLNLSPLTLTACYAEEDTKAAFSENEYPVIEWKGDAISILGTATGNQEFTTTSASKTAEFTGLADLTDQTLYAVYPYDANIALNDNGTLANVKIPEIQTATAGSFDPKAYVAVAKCTDKATLNFKALGSFLKFQVANASTVKSVTFIGNNNENMAASANQVTVTDAPVHGGPSSSSPFVRVQGTFEAGKYYFAIIRPMTYSKGLTICVEYWNDPADQSKGTTIKYCSTSTKISAARNRIMKLGSAPLAPTKDVTEDLYACYLMGKNVKVGKTNFIKSADGAPAPSVLIASENDVDLYGTINGTSKNKIVFLTQEGDSKFILGKTANLNERVLLVSRYADSKTSMVCSDGAKVLAKSGSLYFKNININCSNTVSYFIYNYNQTTNVDALVFDGCKITNIDLNLLAFTGSGIVSNIEILNSDLVFKATASTSDAAAIIKSNQTVTYPNVDIEQNLLYCENNNARQVAIFSNANATRNASIGKLVFARNLVAGLYPTPNYYYVMVKSLTDYTVKNNYFHLPKYLDYAKVEGVEKYTGIVRTDTNPTKIDLAKDYMYYDSSTGIPTLAFKSFYTDISGKENPYMKTDNLLTIDWGKGTFTCSNSGYGPQR